MMADHKQHASGRWKTVCTSAVLDFFGIGTDRYHYSGSVADMLRILSANGWSYGSRRSSIPKDASVGKLRPWLNKRQERGVYIVKVHGHVLLLNCLGTTIVDTAPRLRDRRKVQLIYRIVRK